MDEARTPRRTAIRGNPARGELYGTLTRILLFAAGLVVVLWFAFTIRQALLLLVLAAILALVLNAPVAWLEGRGMGRGPATGVVFVLLLAMLGGIGWLVVPRLVQEVPTLIDEVPAAAQQQVEQLSAWLGGAPEVDRQVSQLIAWLERMAGEAWRILDRVAAGVVLVLFVVALVLYMVADPRPILQWYVRSLPFHLREPAVRAFHRSSRMVVGWIIANAIMGGIKATGAFIFLSLMDVPGAVLWSLLALFAALIPQVGFYIMSIPPVLMALTVDPMTALWTLLFFLALSEFLGKFVAPRVQGEIMEMHAAYLLFMTLALGLAFGLLGVLIAVPVAGFLKVYYEEFYLRSQPEDPQLDERVEEMMEGSLDGARATADLARG
jgi:putative permease